MNVSAKEVALLVCTDEIYIYLQIRKGERYFLPCYIHEVEAWPFYVDDRFRKVAGLKSSTPVLYYHFGDFLILRSTLI